ncbi:MAG: hypothetical protein ACKVP5_04140 [Aestuariivirga sp.]
MAVEERYKKLLSFTQSRTSQHADVQRPTSPRGASARGFEGFVRQYTEFFGGLPGQGDYPWSYLQLSIFGHQAAD